MEAFMPKFKALLLVCVFIFVSSSAQAKIIHVPSDSSTIQKGINGAVNGDTVLVAEGTYYEHINFNGKAILVKSEKGAESTIINKLYGGLPIMVFNSGEDTNSVIDGFTVQNADNSTGEGGAFCCLNSSSPTIRNNIIKNNKGGTFGGGIYCNNSSPTIQRNVIKENIAFDGGGIACYTNSSPVIEDNTIIGNTTSVWGGGIFCYVNSSPIINDNILMNNYAANGGGIGCLYYSSPSITGNLLIENDASAGGAIICVTSSSPVIINNTLDRNYYSSSSGHILCDDNSSPNIKNSIFSNGSGCPPYFGPV
jgi:hypothetical protein